MGVGWTHKTVGEGEWGGEGAHRVPCRCVDAHGDGMGEQRPQRVDGRGQEETKGGLRGLVGGARAGESACAGHGGRPTLASLRHE